MDAVNEKLIFSTVEEAVDDLRAGRFIVIVDDKDRENEGDLVMAAEFVEPTHIDFYEREARGWICVPVTPDECERLQLPLMVNHNTALHGTPFTVTVDYRHGTTTGISASDQAKTIRALSDGYSRPEDFARPGHVRPLKAVGGGVLARAGHTEAVVDLMRISGLRPAGVLCEIKKAGGEMARLPELSDFRRRHDLKLITIEDLIEYRLRTEKLVERIIEADLPTQYGIFRSIAYGVPIRNEQHLALVLGDITGDEPVIVRVASECVLGDVFRCLVCDCDNQLSRALEIISREGKGVVLYLRRSGSGWEMVNWLRYLAKVQAGDDIPEELQKVGKASKHRDYGTGAQILRDLGLNKIRLITDSDFKMVGLKAYGIEIVERISLNLDASAEAKETREHFGDLESHSGH
jgi:3,4-dihydroxy 2-butanone 4-phosphate synthase/GTP cyclohydrolase II